MRSFCLALRYIDVKEKNMKKTLEINVAQCDMRHITPEVAGQYKRLVINAAAVLTSPAAESVLQDIPVTINAADILSVPENAEVSIHNGSYVLDGAQGAQKPTVLMVNGRLTVEKSAETSLQNYLAIRVNGQILYPASLAGKLPMLQVNGRTITYPDEAMLLKNNAVIDRLFLLRAKEGLYYAPRSIILSDEQLDVQALIQKGVRFLAPKMFVAEELLEDALPMIDDTVDISVIPKGFGYLQGSQELSLELLRAHGRKIYVSGDLLLREDAKEALAQVEGCHVQGKVLLPEDLLEAFLALRPVYGSVTTYQGVLYYELGNAVADAASLALHPGGATYAACGVVRLGEDISADTILKKLRFIECGVIECHPSQLNAVNFRGKDIGHVDPSGAWAKKHSPQERDDVQVINAASYTF